MYISKFKHYDDIQVNFYEKMSNVFFEALKNFQPIKKKSLSNIVAWSFVLDYDILVNWLKKEIRIEIQYNYFFFLNLPEIVFQCTEALVDDLYVIKIPISKVIEQQTSWIRCDWKYKKIIIENFQKISLVDVSILYSDVRKWNIKFLNKLNWEWELIKNKFGVGTLFLQNDCFFNFLSPFCYKIIWDKKDFVSKIENSQWMITNFKNNQWLELDKAILTNLIEPLIEGWIIEKLDLEKKKKFSKHPFMFTEIGIKRLCNNEVIMRYNKQDIIKQWILKNEKSRPLKTNQIWEWIAYQSFLIERYVVIKNHKFEKKFNMWDWNSTSKIYFLDTLEYVYQFHSFPYVFKVLVLNGFLYSKSTIWEIKHLNYVNCFWKHCVSDN